MSFFEVEQATTRLNRSELAVPGSSPDFFEKAAKSDTDVIFLDLEDAVAPDYTGITVNTLTVADFKHHDRMLGRGFQGPHPQELLRG